MGHLAELAGRRLGRVVNALERLRHVLGGRRRVVLNREVQSLNVCRVVGHAGLDGSLAVLLVHQPPEGFFDLGDFRTRSAEYFAEGLVSVSSYVDDVVPQ
jgi:hypothetical protein